MSSYITPFSKVIKSYWNRSLPTWILFKLNIEIRGCCRGLIVPNPLNTDFSRRLKRLFVFGNQSDLFGSVIVFSLKVEWKILWKMNWIHLLQLQRTFTMKTTNFLSTILKISKFSWSDCLTAYFSNLKVLWLIQLESIYLFLRCCQKGFSGWGGGGESVKLLL